LGAPLNPELVSLPISFEKNVGQAPAAYEFLSRHGSVEALFSQTGVDMVLPDLGGVRARIGFRLLGAQPDAFPQGHNQIPGVSNYLLGADSSRWIRGVLNYEQVLYRGIYPGIDLVFHGTGREIEHDFRIAPNADPNRLCFRIEAIRGLTLTSAGDLAISMPSGELVFRKPVAYQQSARGRESVTAAFVINADGSVHFRLGAYDRSRELVIDPVFSFSTYLAGSNYDQAFGLTTDSSGNVYVTGTTESLDFPIKDGVQTTNGGASAGFVSKLDPTGHTLLYGLDPLTGTTS